MNNTWEYELSDLLPVVKKLVEGYTSKESTSVTYETAERLMQAASYCIYENKRIEKDGEEFSDTDDRSTHQYQVGTNVVDENKSYTAMEAYERGYQILLHKVRYIQAMYNQMIEYFDAYGNKNYAVTVLEGIPAFLTHYDAKYHPQDHILSMDYPVLGPLEEDCGANVILSYLKKIELEQRFLREFPKEYVEEILTYYHCDYQEMFFNICAPFFRYILVCGLLKRPIVSGVLKDCEYEKLIEYVLSHTTVELNERFQNILSQLCEHFEEGNKLFLYLSTDLKDFIFELQNAVKYNQIEAVFHQC